MIDFVDIFKNDKANWMFTTQMVANLCGVTYSTVIRWCRSEKLNATKDNMSCNMLQIWSQDFCDFLKRNPKYAARVNNNLSRFFVENGVSEEMATPPEVYCLCTRDTYE
jgi:hypothetical protein